jgi:UrcA family protein
MHTSLLALLASLAAAALLVVFAPPAAARPHSERTRVHVSDLDLSTDSDAARMLRRIERAADRMCAETTISVPDPRVRAAFKECRAATIATAVAELRAARVSDAYARRYAAN